DTASNRAAAALVRAFNAVLNRTSTIDLSIWLPLLNRIAAFTPSWLQQWKIAAKEKTLPKAWVSPIDGTPLPNPWVTKDLAGQAILRGQHPELADLMEAMAQDPYGTTLRLQKEEQQKRLMRDTNYGVDEHAGNAFRALTEPSVEAQNNFARMHPQPVIDIW